MTTTNDLADDGIESMNWLSILPGRMNPSALEDGLGFTLMEAYLYAHRKVTKVLHHFDLQHQDFAAMDVIWANPGHTQTANCAIYGIRDSNSVDLRINLEHRHFAERRKVPKNRRAFALHRSSSWKTMLRKMELAHSHAEKRPRARRGAEPTVAAFVSRVHQRLENWHLSLAIGQGLRSASNQKSFTGLLNHCF